MLHKKRYMIISVTIVLFMLIILIGNILEIGDILHRLNKDLDIAFYVFISIVIFSLIIIPMIKSFFIPHIKMCTLLNTENEISWNRCCKIAKMILKNKSLTSDEVATLQDAIKHGRDLRSPLVNILELKMNEIGHIIQENAKLVFISTTISQNGRLDALMVLISNIRMIKEIINHIGYRPTLLELVKIYTYIFMSALVADGLEDLELDEAFPQLSTGVFGMIPGLPFLVSSITQGIGNAYLTLRIGYAAQSYIQNAKEVTSYVNIRRTVYRYAIKNLKSVVIQSISLLPSSIGEIIKKIY